ncbi:hypothetical protein E2C01_020607 [Portunus trituberculatus]|uniref:Uncharacterized protein n=1 Tax=Portunus trituberculatus TaxID=210409 RepID=A0A5B7E271_PORTR|nr:hypothetical protein [Portunus trituberculatus]
MLLGSLKEGKRRSLARPRGRERYEVSSYAEAAKRPRPRTSLSDPNAVATERLRSREQLSDLFRKSGWGTSSAGTAERYLPWTPLSDQSSGTTERTRPREQLRNLVRSSG